LTELCSNDDENPSLVEIEKGWLIHDYSEQQDTKADVEARRERNKANGQKGGLAKAKRGAKRPAKQPASDSVSENVAETETETHTEVTTDVVTSGDASGKPKRAKPRKRVADDYMPSSAVVDTIREELHGVTDEQLQYQHRKFIDHWKKTGKPMADWDATWRNWMRTANERGELGHRNGSTHGGQVHKLRAISQLAANVRAQEQAELAVNQRRAVE
jgi:hypothetical protein